MFNPLEAWWAALSPWAQWGVILLAGLGAVVVVGWFDRFDKSGGIT